jgi:glyoxylase-like metal-dependent hydrolase (beta-lactamase superfamily II)
MEIAPGVHSIGPTTAGLVKGGYAHAYLFVNDDELTLVDTLWDDDAHVVLKYLSQIGRSPKQLKHIALTHGHRSHLGGLATLQGLSGAKVYAHEAEAEIIAGRKPAPRVRLDFLRPMILYPFRILALLHLPKHTPCEVTVSLKDDVKPPDIGGLEVIYTPGHTPGHLAFYHAEHKVLIAGDAVATWPSFGAGWPGFNQNEEQYQDSLRKLVKMDTRYVGTGHGEPIENAGTTRLASLVRPSQTLTQPGTGPQGKNGLSTTRSTRPSSG